MNVKDLSKSLWVQCIVSMLFSAPYIQKDRSKSLWVQGIVSMQVMRSFIIRLSSKSLWVQGIVSILEGEKIQQNQCAKESNSNFWMPSQSRGCKRVFLQHATLPTRDYLAYGSESNNPDYLPHIALFFCAILPRSPEHSETRQPPVLLPMSSVVYC